MGNRTLFYRWRNRLRELDAICSGLQDGHNKQNCVTTRSLQPPVGKDLSAELLLTLSFFSGAVLTGRAQNATANPAN